jgi:hypothetical protein
MNNYVEWTTNTGSPFTSKSDPVLSTCFVGSTDSTVAVVSFDWCSRRHSKRDMKAAKTKGMQMRPARRPSDWASVMPSVSEPVESGVEVLEDIAAVIAGCGTLVEVGMAEDSVRSTTLVQVTSQAVHTISLTGIRFRCRYVKDTCGLSNLS